jgi:hypothetical protein
MIAYNFNFRVIYRKTGKNAIFCVVIGITESRKSCERVVSKAFDWIDTETTFGSKNYTLIWIAYYRARREKPGI